jgi:16S rRNA (uracil1498-N3)-methyltransferase
MRIPRLYSPQPLVKGSRLALDGRAVRYVVQVLRLRPGAELSLFDGQGAEHRAVLERVERRAAEVWIGEPLERNLESSLHIVLGQGISRGERMDYALQKAVELGVSSVVPLLTRYSPVNFSGTRAEKRHHHWQGVVISACEQCGRNSLPSLERPQPLAAFLSRQGVETKVLLNPLAKLPLKVLPPPRESRLMVLIGPEGGLSEGEIQAAQQAGFIGVRLGPRILRTETATVVTLAALQLLWGDV